MKKKIVTRPIQTLSLEFEDGKTKDLKFTNYTVAILDEEFEEGSMNIIFNSFKKPYLYGTRIIYAGMKTVDETVKFDDVKRLVVEMDFATLFEIMQFAIENLYGSQEENQKKTMNNAAMKQAQEILKSILT